VIRTAFYAPMKPPTHPSPSGDRTVARLLMEALRAGGHEVELASAYRCWEGAGDSRRQQRLGLVGLGLARRVLRRYRARPPSQRPKVWLTYHLYHKAPDWLGPCVTRGLQIPYIVAEASYSPRQAGGPWKHGLEASVDAIRHAARIVVLNGNDLAGLRTLLGNDERLVRLPPFLPPALRQTHCNGGHSRSVLASRLGLDPDTPWLLTVAMMRARDKLASYRLLAAALSRLEKFRWCLIVVGDGAARAQVEDALSCLPSGRVTFVGEQPPAALPLYHTAADLFVWPAVNEAWGMALLEAQAAGLPVVAGRYGGVADIVQPGVTGMLSEAGDIGGFATATAELLRNPQRRAAMAAAARKTAARRHGFDTAAAILDDTLRAATARQ